MIKRKVNYLSHQGAKLERHLFAYLKSAFYNISICLQESKP